MNVARDIFGRQTRITYIDLCEQLQQVLDIKERTAKSYIRFMRERDIITKDTANQSCFVIGSYNLQWNTSRPKAYGSCVILGACVLPCCDNTAGFFRTPSMGVRYRV